jgi:hypothetical protein
MRIKNRFKFSGFGSTYTTLWDIKVRRKEAGYRKAPGGVPVFPYFLVLLVYAYIFMKAVSTYLWAYHIHIHQKVWIGLCQI